MNNLDNQDILSGMDRFIDDIKQSNSAKAKSNVIEALKRTNVIKENGGTKLIYFGIYSFGKLKG